MAKRAFFSTCAECGCNQPNHSGVCDRCAVTHGYANDNRAPVVFSDDVDPGSREDLNND
jgi:predicted ATP-dependent serine protease